MANKILVVDDHPGIRLLLLEIFSHEGYNVTMASNGQEAIDLINSEVFNLVILDRHLPIFDGLEVVKHIAKLKKPSTVLFISGLSDGLEEEIKEYEFVKAIVEKPFNINDFYDIVKRNI